jgi:hypothetical protein
MGHPRLFDDRKGQQGQVLIARRWRALGLARNTTLNNLPEIDYTAKWIHRFAMAIATTSPMEITGKDG